MRWLFDVIVIIGGIAICGFLIVYLVSHPVIDPVKVVAERTIPAGQDGVSESRGGLESIRERSKGSNNVQDISISLHPPIFCEKWVPGYWEPITYWGMSGVHTVSRRWRSGFWKITDCE
jgi:hypothetical protein